MRGRRRANASRQTLRRDVFATDCGYTSKYTSIYFPSLIFFLFLLRTFRFFLFRLLFFSDSFCRENLCVKK